MSYILLPEMFVENEATVMSFLVSQLNRTSVIAFTIILLKDTIESMRMWKFTESHRINLVSRCLYYLGHYLLWEPSKWSFISFISLSRIDIKTFTLLTAGQISHKVCCIFFLPLLVIKPSYIQEIKNIYLVRNTQEKMWLSSELSCGLFWKALIHATAKMTPPSSLF